MKPLSYQSLLDNPDLLDSLHRKARRERAEAVYPLVIAPFRALFMRTRPAPSAEALAACHDGAVHGQSLDIPDRRVTRGRC